MKVAIFGLPASGKGTLCQSIAETFTIKHISSGDILRSYFAKNKEATDTISGGGFATDELVIGLLRAEIGDSYLLDGFPRNITQIDVFPVDFAIYLKADYEICLQRALSRGGERADDKPEIFKKRVKIYEDCTLPVIEEFKKRGCLIEIDGGLSKEEVFRIAVEKLKELLKTNIVEVQDLFTHEKGETERESGTFYVEKK